ncbi:response regulator [Methanobacterium sp.]|uniref:response regulator n=1 Tax=Methanobacterium sp. TaxID=2164 RepID=UPI003C732199
MHSKPIKILLIEDNREDAIIIREMLKETLNISFELNHVDRLKTGFESLFNNPFDVLLLDLNLPDSWGFDTFIRTYDQAPELPIVIMSGFDDEDVAVKAVREGAQDYLIKGQIDGRLLARSISYAIERKETEKELMKSQKDLRELIEWHEKELLETERKLQEEINEREKVESKLIDALKAAETERSKLDTLISRLPVGILIVEASSGKPLIKNKKLEDIWNDCLEIDELAEYCYYNGSHPDGRPYELEDWPLTRSITSGEEIEDEKIIISKEDGTKSVIISSSIPIRDNNGQIVMGMSIFSDID